MRTYRHTQVGGLILAMIGVTLVVVASIAVAAGFHPVLLVVIGVEALVMLLFGWLTVEVAGGVVRLRFGTGPIGRSFELSEIREVQCVRNHWYWGWGIRWFGRGWLFNVSGLDAVEIVMSSGKVYRIGTDEPKRLARAIDEARGAAA